AKRPGQDTVDCGEQRDSGHPLVYLAKNIEVPVVVVESCSRRRRTTLRPVRRTIAEYVVGRTGVQRQVDTGGCRHEVFDSRGSFLIGEAGRVVDPEVSQCRIQRKVARCYQATK